MNKLTPPSQYKTIIKQVRLLLVNAMFRGSDHVHIEGTRLSFEISRTGTDLQAQRYTTNIMNTLMLVVLLVKSLNETIVTGGDKLGHPLYN